jgi:hypothetical protein
VAVPSRPDGKVVTDAQVHERRASRAPGDRPALAWAPLSPTAEPSL